MSAPRGVSAAKGVSAPRGVSAPMGMSAPGDVASQHAMRQTPPCEQNDKQVQKYYVRPVISVC